MISQSDGVATAVTKFGQAIEQIVGKREFKTVPNEFYPAESFEEFVSHCIQSKKSKIKSILEIF